MDIVNKIKIEVLRKNETHTEKDGLDVFNDHIQLVVKNARDLARKYGADIEIVELGALLHDIAIITNDGPEEEHHIYGAKLAEELLTKYNYPKDRIERVKKCVLNHRGMEEFPRKTIEEEIVADSDVIAHFDAIPSLFSRVFNALNMNLEQGTVWVRKKLERDYNKLSPRTKKLLKDRYDNIMKVLFIEEV